MMKGSILDQIQEKLMTKFLKILEKPYFGPILPIFGPLKFFFENPAPLRTTSHWSLPAYQFSKKSNHRIPRKCPDRDGRKDKTISGNFCHYSQNEIYSKNSNFVSKLQYPRGTLTSCKLSKNSYEPVFV